MACAVHGNVERDTSWNNNDVTCPVNALRHFTPYPVTTGKMYLVKDGVTATLDFETEFYARCGICAEACQNNVIRISGKGSGENPSNEFQKEAQGGI